MKKNKITFETLILTEQEFEQLILEHFTIDNNDICPCKYKRMKTKLEKKIQKIIIIQ
jgi:hypothetical protein